MALSSTSTLPAVFIVVFLEDADGSYDSENDFVTTDLEVAKQHVADNLHRVGFWCVQEFRDGRWVKTHFYRDGTWM